MRSATDAISAPTIPQITTSEKKPPRPEAGADKLHGQSHRKSDSAIRSLVKGLLIPLLALSVALGLVAYIMTNWTAWTGLAPTQTTDDAQIRAETSRVASRISGTVRQVAVQDFQRVRAGDLLAEIDPADYSAALDRAQASLSAAEATLANLSNQIALQRATIMQAEAASASAAAKELETRQERQRQESLLPTGAGTRQRLEQAVSAHETAIAGLRSAQAAVVAQNRQLDVLFGNQKQEEAQVAAARATLETAKLQLGYTRIVAPVDGVVGERLVQVGNYVSVGTALISIVPLPDVYVIANYKETQLTNVAVDQPVHFTVDAFPGVEFRGRVERISPASGSQFALLPPDNATGNFTKVVQRIPVRIAPDTDQPMLERLRPGMSVITSIETAKARTSAAQP